MVPTGRWAGAAAIVLGGLLPPPAAARAPIKGAEGLRGGRGGGARALVDCSSITKGGDCKDATGCVWDAGKCSGPTPVACAGPFDSTLTRNSDIYQVGDAIRFDWAYGADEARAGDWLAVYPSTHSGIGCDVLPAGSTMWVFLSTLSQVSSSEIPGSAGTVTFSGEPPDESQSDVWPLDPGSYRAFIVRDGAAASAPYDTIAVTDEFTVEAPVITTPATTTANPVSTAAYVGTDKTSYQPGEAIIIDWDYNTDAPRPGDWLAIYPSSYDGVGSEILPGGSTMWLYVAALDQSSNLITPSADPGVVTFDGSAPDESGTQSWPLDPGSWRAFIVRDVAAPYDTVAASAAFTVEGNTCPASYSDYESCQHQPPTDDLPVSKVFFSSCYQPGNQINDKLWADLRARCASDANPDVNDCVFVWLGDNAYLDTTNMETMRSRYTAARCDQHYSGVGPASNNLPKIPTTGTWDDHDLGQNNDGKYYPCKAQSQAEFAYHFNLPADDPRYPDGVDQREGVYHSFTFQNPANPAGDPGVHLITLDARYHRSPTKPSHGVCEGDASTMLGADQWSWLEAELSRPSEIKVIGSGIQVLPPTYQSGKANLCANDDSTGEFDAANEALGEGPGTDDGTDYEQWGEMAQERTKLLHMVQDCLANGHAKRVVFISGDQHWQELHAKEIPSRADGTPATKVWEVTASGIDQNWYEAIPNPNRVHVRRADTRGSGPPYDVECMFPFSVSDSDPCAQNQGGKACRDAGCVWSSGQCSSTSGPVQTLTYDGCTMDALPSGENQTSSYGWCLKSDDVNDWGYCEPPNPDHIKEVASKEHTCSDSALHVCTARAGFGGVTVDWAEQTITLDIFTPHETQVNAASITIPMTSS